MSEIYSKSCKICLSPNTDSELNITSSLDRFFTHVLGFQCPPLELWLCVWCKSVLRKIVKLMYLAEESQAFLLKVKMVNTTNNNLFKENVSNNLFTLSVHHNEHYDIPPEEAKKNKDKKSKTGKKSRKNKIQFVSLKESEEDINITEIKEENKVDEMVVNEVKLETIEMEGPIDDIHDDMHDLSNDINDEVKLDKPKRKVNPKLYEKCEENNFTLKILTFEEQMAELEEKKRSDKYLGRKYKCEFCAVGFVTKDVYEEHNKRHQESHSPHECPICHLRFSTSLVLSQHLLAHQRRFTCRLCQTVICRYSDCEYHRLKCGQATPGVCPHCKKIFSNQNSLEQHIRGVHYEKEKKFVCSFCSQRFQSKQRLAIHTRTHTGAKPYSCDLCHRSFAANSNLRNHLSSHAMARPHYCVECDKSYKTRKGLRRHLLEGATHLGRQIHSCHHCLKNFTSEKHLASHISSAHTKERDACAICNKSSTCTDLKKHIKSGHETSVI